MIEGLRPVGQECFFEYHCWESDSSNDTDLWHRSHQKVIITGIAPNDAYMPDSDVVPVPSLDERYDSAVLISYTIRFMDGYEGVAVEDELLDSANEYSRPDPPRRRGRRRLEIKARPTGNPIVDYLNRNTPETSTDYESLNAITLKMFGVEQDISVFLMYEDKIIRWTPAILREEAQAMLASMGGRVIIPTIGEKTRLTDRDKAWKYVARHLMAKPRPRILIDQCQERTCKNWFVAGNTCPKRFFCCKACLMRDYRDRLKGAR